MLTALLSIETTWYVSMCSVSFLEKRGKLLSQIRDYLHTQLCRLDMWTNLWNHCTHIGHLPLMGPAGAWEATDTCFLSKLIGKKKQCFHK